MAQEPPGQAITGSNDDGLTVVPSRRLLVFGLTIWLSTGAGSLCKAASG